jgi:hypothetical protein
VQVRADVLEGLWGDTRPQPAPPGGPGGASLPDEILLDAPPKQQLAVDLANLQFVWPGAPLRLTIGRQEVSWGAGYWTRADSRDRFDVGLKLDPVVVVFAYDKFTEVGAAHGALGDWRAVAIGAVTEAAGFELGLLLASMRDESRATFPQGDVEYLAGDLFAAGAIGPVNVRVEGVLGGGRLERPDGTRLDLGGLGGYAGVFLPLGRTLTLGLEGAYARGDKPGTPGTNEGFFSADYQGPYWSLVFYNNLDVRGYAGDVQTSDPGRDVSVRNAVTGKLSAVFAPSRRFSLTVAGLYAAADQVTAGVARPLGWEFDLLAVTGVTERVTLSAGVGCAILGDYWKTAPVAGGTGEKPDNPLAVVLALTTTF